MSSWTALLIVEEELFCYLYWLFKHSFEELFSLNWQRFFFLASQEILKLSRCVVEKINSKKLTCVLRNSRGGIKLYRKCSKSNLVLELDEPIKIHIMSLNSCCYLRFHPRARLGLCTLDGRMLGCSHRWKLATACSALPLEKAWVLHTLL